MSEKLYYTGVGARVTPEAILDVMTNAARALNARGYILRSGGAKGADTYFECGAGDNVEIFRPNNSNGGVNASLPKAYEIAARHHPVWDSLDNWAKDLMARNVHAVLGKDLETPSKFLLCWTQDGIFRAQDRTSKSGGTGHTISVAYEYGVPVFNLKNEKHYYYVMRRLVNIGV